jgi:hypothetical protein
MEYLAAARGNEPHRRAEAALRQLGFRPSRIAADGSLVRCDDVEAHLSATAAHSDNIVFSADRP